MFSKASTDVEKLVSCNVHGCDDDNLVVLTEESVELCDIVELLLWDMLLVMHNSDLSDQNRKKVTKYFLQKF